MTEDGALPMIESQDVRLTVVGLNHDEGESYIDIGKIAEQMKRLLALWLCLAIGFGGLTCAAGLASRKILLAEDVKALVSFSYDNSATIYNIRKIKSPGVVEDALNDLGLDILDMEDIRNAIEINGVIPDHAQDQMSMYYNLLSQSGSNSGEAVRSLLGTSYDVTRYIISFDYASVHMDSNAGIDFMNALLRAYQNYFAKNYNYNKAMGNPLSAVDYHDYDYAEAVNIFSTTLDSVISYLSSVESSGTTGFRSVETGFNFQDLRRTAATLRDIDLDRVSSYIVIHSVSTFDAATEISYYEWLIENLTRQRTVERARLSSLTNSIEEYEKDPILVAVQDGNSVVTNMEDLNANYDAMITEKLNTQAAITSYTRSISYYESVIEGFRNAETASTEDIEKVEGYLSSLNEKLNLLIDNTVKSIDEYYEKVAFSNRIQVLIPASLDNPPIISEWAVEAVVVVELIIFAIFFATAIISGTITHDTFEQSTGKDNHQERHSS